jgi:Cu+-exporting ATPase
MNFFKTVFLFFIIFNITVSCHKNTKEVSTNSSKETLKSDTNIAANYKKMEFHIKGMTCEIGCARLIQSKLSKTDGVKTVKISFTDSLGMIEYDTNKLSVKNIRAVVDNISDGDLYKVTDTKDVSEFSLLEKK